MRDWVKPRRVKLNMLSTLGRPILFVNPEIGALNDLKHALWVGVVTLADLA